MKAFMDGTLKIHTGAMIDPYPETQTKGSPAFTKEELAELIKLLNEEDLDLHLHTVGDNASRVVLDAVELARKELGDDYHVKVTCAHLEVQDDADLPRFAELGVIANYTPWWHAGNTGGSSQNAWCEQLGEKRANSMYRCKTLWDTGAYVTWSSDEVYYGDFMVWNPYLGMEVGMTRHITEKTKAYEWDRTDTIFPPNCERMSIDEMILGYTINGARQLGIDAYKGSIKPGKDADFLVFDKDLLMAEHEGFSYNIPKHVYICGERMS
jgi:predicted amidohydrolase YtcJ